MDKLGVSAHSLYKWVKAATPDDSEQRASELLQAKSEVLKLRAQQRILIHSDQGTQFSSDDWRRFCHEHNLEPSMSRRGNCSERAACPRGIMLSPSPFLAV